MGVTGLEEREPRGLVHYLFEHSTRPFNSVEFSSINPEVNTFSFPEHLINQPFSVWVEVNCYYVSDDLREAMERQYIEAMGEEEENYTPPTETYRQDHCVVCLESKPNILYLDCMHIAICDSCDRLKKTKRYKCDVCRTRISKRVKI